MRIILQEASFAMKALIPRIEIVIVKQNYPYPLIHSLQHLTCQSKSLSQFISYWVFKKYWIIENIFCVFEWLNFTFEFNQK